MKEAAIVRKILVLLQARGAWTLKVHGGPFQRPGVPDILACLPRPGGPPLFLALEVKRPGETATKLQARELAAIRAAGGLAAVVTSAEDVESLIVTEPSP